MPKWSATSVINIPDLYICDLVFEAIWSINVAEWSVILVGLVISGRKPVVSIDSIRDLVLTCVWNFSSSMLKSPIMYDSLFSLWILLLISDIFVRKSSISARGCVLGR